MGENKFVAFAAIPAGAQVGPRPAADLWTLVPATGLDAGMNVMCQGDFIGTVAIETSLDGVSYSPAGAFIRGDGIDQSPELAPIVIAEIARYVRPSVMQG